VEGVQIFNPLTNNTNGFNRSINNNIQTFRQVSLREGLNLAKKQNLDKKCTTFFYEANVTFNVVRHMVFIKVVKTTFEFSGSTMHWEGMAYHENIEVTCLIITKSIIWIAIKPCRYDWTSILLKVEDVNNWPTLCKGPCHNPSIEFATKCEVQGPMRLKSVFRCETHSHKWGRMQGMKPNDSQMHSHFGNCSHARIANVQSHGWKRKETPNWAPMIPLEFFWNEDA
jgi:hypothetical protein